MWGVVYYREPGGAMPALEKLIETPALLVRRDSVDLSKRYVGCCGRAVVLASSDRPAGTVGLRWAEAGAVRVSVSSRRPDFDCVGDVTTLEVRSSEGWLVNACLSADEFPHRLRVSPMMVPASNVPSSRWSDAIADEDIEVW